MNNMKKRLPAILLVVVVSFLNVMAQQVIRGEILDKVTKEVLPFAGIAIIKNKISTVSNENGQFVITIPKAHQNDTLSVSFIGYHLHKTPLANIVKELTIELEPATTPLDEVVVKAIFNAKDTIRKAIGLIPVNYGVVPVMLEGFYRETLVEDRTNQYLIFAEGLLEIYKDSYEKTGDDDEVRLVKGRKKKLVYVLPPIINGPHIGILLDFVKSNDFFINPSIFEKYHYKFSGVTTLNEAPVYVFEFQPKKENQVRAYFQGKVYVQINTLAFVRGEYQLSKGGLATVNSTSAMPIINRQYTANYVKYNGKWSFQSGNLENQLVYQKSSFENSTIDAPLTSNINFTVTARDIRNVSRFKEKDKISVEQTLVETIQEWDDSFWGDSNIIKAK